jgi:hypothetical protein
MAENIFKAVSMKKGDAQKSYTWYRAQVRNLGSGVSGLNLIRSETLSSRIIPGEMYLFMYDPKHKDTLPYYDTMPLVLPFRQLPDGFLGINLHYLPYLARFNLLGELSKLATDKNMDENTRIKISWQILNSSTSYTMATACVKHYLKNHIRTRFLKIDMRDWVTAAMLPVENFKKAKKETVWQETKNKYGY